MPELSFEVFCSCGNGLCAQTKVISSARGEYVTIEPCERCMDRARDEGEDIGYDKGYEAARAKYQEVEE